MSVNQNPVNKQKLIWSSIRNKLNISLHQENLLVFLRSQEIQTILQKFLSFYTDGNKNEDLPNNLKLLSKYDLTNQMKELIYNIAGCLNMTRMRSFELLDDGFVETHFKQYATEMKREYYSRFSGGFSNNILFRLPSLVN